MTKRRSYGGKGHGGGGSGRNTGRGYGGRWDGSSGQYNRYNRNGDNNNNGNKTYEFAPHSVGKQQKITYYSMKDHVILKIQKEYKCGNDIAE